MNFLQEMMQIEAVQKTVEDFDNHVKFFKSVAAGKTQYDF